MSLLPELDVLEVPSFLVTELYQPIPEQARLLDRAAGVVHPVHEEELRLQILGVVDRAPLPPQRSVLLRVAQVPAQEVLEVLHALLVQPQKIAYPDPGNPRLP